MKVKSQKDFWSGVMFVIVGAVFAWGSTEYSFGSSARPGPGYFPFGLGIILVGLGALIVFKALTFEVEGGDPIGAVAWRPLLVILGSVVVFGALLPRVGLVVTLPIMVIIASFAGDEFSWTGVIITAIVLTIGSYAIFNWGLNLTIPMLPDFSSFKSASQIATPVMVAASDAVAAAGSQVN